MVERTPAPPRLSGAQRLWLLELGLDRPMLARLTPDRVKRPSRPVRHQESPLQADTAAPDNRSQAAAAFAALRQVSDSPSSARARPTPSTHVPVVSAANPAVSDRPIASKTPTEAGSMPSIATVAAEHHADQSVPADWAALEARIQACQICELHTGRQRAVAGSGAIEAVDWLVVGEAPGERDDRLGQPFQGKAGELLHAMLGAAGIDPTQAIFYTNLVKCRPRSNRLPTADEIAACLPHLQSQIALLRPRGILALGRLAAQALLAVDESTDRRAFDALRGQIHHFQAPGSDPIPLVVTYHPASLLSRPRHKAASWCDLNLARTLNTPDA